MKLILALLLAASPIVANAFCPSTNDPMSDMRCRSYEMQQLKAQQQAYQQTEALQRQAQAMEQMNLNAQLQNRQYGPYGPVPRY